MGMVRGGLAAVALVALAGCTDRSADGDLTVFAAASLTDAFEEIGAAFEAERDGVEVTFAFGASSSLREQILGGAPADVFASAAPGPIDALVDEGLVEDPVPFARNSLAIAVPAGGPGRVASLADLADPSLLVGLCAEEVPCGALARQVIDDAGIEVRPDTEEVDVRALLGKVVAGELDAGLVYVTDIQAAGRDVEGIDLGSDATTEYPVAVVRGDPDDVALARGFVRFVRGPVGRRILADAGFGSP